MLQRIHDRIDILRQYLADEDEGSKINMESLALFITFVELLDEEVEKGLSVSLTPDNNVYANFKEHDVKYCMHFRSDGLIRMFKM